MHSWCAVNIRKKSNWSTCLLWDLISRIYLYRAAKEMQREQNKKSSEDKMFGSQHKKNNYSVMLSSVSMTHFCTHLLVMDSLFSRGLHLPYKVIWPISRYIHGLQCDSGTFYYGRIWFWFGTIWFFVSLRYSLFNYKIE